MGEPSMRRVVPVPKFEVGVSAFTYASASGRNVRLLGKLVLVGVGDAVGVGDEVAVAVGV